MSCTLFWFEQHLDREELGEEQPSPEIRDGVMPLMLEEGMSSASVEEILSNREGEASCGKRNSKSDKHGSSALGVLASLASSFSQPAS